MSEQFSQMTPEEQDALIEAIESEIDAALNDPEFREEGEEMHRRLTYDGWESMRQPFTI